MPPLVDAGRLGRDHIGGYRTMTAASDSYGARPIFRNVIVLPNRRGSHWFR
jgi:hypothetical protein